MESSWLSMIKRIQALAATGLGFTPNEFDRERYEEISLIAATMLSDLAQVPLKRITDLVNDDVKGYVTPKIDVRGAVFRESHILLVKEKSDGLWTLPGGYADVGLSAAENIEKEVLEEAGISVRASYLYAVKHKAKGEYDPDIRDFYKLFFLCTPKDSTAVKPGPETSDAAFFKAEEIPPLSRSRVVENDLHDAWKFSQKTDYSAFFD